MKLTYTIEANENGYTVLLEESGSRVFRASYKKTETGSERIEGDDEDELEPPWFEFINDYCFAGFDLHRIAAEDIEYEDVA